MKILIVYLLIGISLWFFVGPAKEKEPFTEKVKGFFNLVLFWPLSLIILLIAANEIRKRK